MSQATERNPDTRARLVRNLMALRMLLSVEQMQTGRFGDRIAELDDALAKLGHDMKSVTASAADGLRRAFLLPRLVNRTRGHRKSRAQRER